MSQAPPAHRDAREQLRAQLLALGAPPAELPVALDAAETVATLTHESALVQACALHAAGSGGWQPDPKALQTQFGGAVAQLLADLGHLDIVRWPAEWPAGSGLGPQQYETLRKMLLAVAADPRLVLVRLAETLVRMRLARSAPAPARQRLALETRELIAPLANRLGIWNIKWELEDLAFRYLEPDEYHRIARALAERRVDRERYIEGACAQIAQALERAGIHGAAISGRPKHIFSIWRKMQRKGLTFEQLFDVRAVRIVLASVPECYAALGVIHGMWHYVAGEFDDYIATPKDNGYRSIHTAVIGPEGKSLEVQIRTRDMHERAELGIAAHWIYKEDGARSAEYERKIAWARRLLDPVRGADWDDDLFERAKGEQFADRIYAMTPRGEVIDLPRGATALDFAYHVHTDLGHRCRGARVNGRIAPLSQALESGEIVEVITGKQAAPSRDWLSPDQGYLHSPRSRAKVRAWFRQHEAAIGTERAEPPPPPPPPPAPVKRAKPARPGSSPIDIEGVGTMPVTLARCCAPVRPEPIAGYVTLARGVTVHRQQCASWLRMQAEHPERALSVAWREDASGLPLTIQVEALDRRGLLRDLTDVLAEEKLSIDGVNSNTDPNDRIATVLIRVAVRDLTELSRVLHRLARVPNVLRARRAH